MGTLFSLVDKLVSSLSSTVVGIAIAAIGLSTLPGGDTPYMEGMKGIVLVLFCVIPMIAWALTLWAMKGYAPVSYTHLVRQCRTCIPESRAEGITRRSIRPFTTVSYTHRDVYKRQR